MKRQVFLSAEQVDLVLVTPEDAEVICDWFNDTTVTSYLGRGAYPMTTGEECDYLEKMYRQPNHLMFGIWQREDQVLIGTIGLHDIDQINQKAVFGICIGEKTYWGKGVGTDALSTLLTHAFERLNLRSVSLSVLGHNERARKCYEKCGFREVGRYPKHIYKDGAWHDEIMMMAVSPTCS